MPGQRSQSRPRYRNAIVLIDYTNVFGVVAERSVNDQPDAVVLDLIKELHRHISDHIHLKPLRTLAFANLPPGHVKGHRATGAWLAQGIEPRFTYARSTDEASAIELAMEAMQLASDAGPDTAFVLLSGNQLFVPLVQRLQRRGHFVLAATLESPSANNHLPNDCQDAYLNADFLLKTGAMQVELDPSGDHNSGIMQASGEPSEVHPITDDIVRKTLEIIDSYFGQYEEIYLTPLLRRLSEIFADSEDEPKTLINDLEKSGAVWLEKRRGFPHNYTILMINENHPDVAEIKDSHSNKDESDYDDGYYDEDEPASDEDAHFDD
ncbi:MAG: NYN domain-containing protein [Bacteroidetes Order II. Incertae sedis bacterium]|nr:NYN domain-containing protein [Bacteroidetes Order II. bacterium]